MEDIYFINVNLFYILEFRIEHALRGIMKLDCLRVRLVRGPVSIAKWSAYTCLLSSPITAGAQI